MKPTNQLIISLTYLICLVHGHGLFNM